MKLETITSQTSEVFLEGKNFSITVNQWANCEGCNLMIHANDLALRMAGALRWEEVDGLIAALAAARAT